MDWFLKLFQWYRSLCGGRWYRVVDTKSGYAEWYREKNMPTFGLFTQVIDTEDYHE
jgi:hypothetical protein